MDMNDLLNDFKKCVSCMTDEDIKESIYNAVKHSENDNDDYKEQSVCNDCKIGDK